MQDDGVAGERVTPTGAAILRQLQPTPRLPPGPGGYARPAAAAPRLSGISNVLRVAVYEGRAAGGRTSGSPCSASKWTIRAPRSWRGLDALRAAEGVLDVVQLPAHSARKAVLPRTSRCWPGRKGWTR